MANKPTISPLNVTATVAAAIMAGRQWQHRVPMRPQPAEDIHPASFPNPDVIGWESSLCHKYGPTTAHIPPMQPGDIFWLREPAKVIDVKDYAEDGMDLVIEYIADGKVAGIEVPARMSDAWELKYKDRWPVPDWVAYHQGIPNGIFREAARTFREVTRVRVERIQDISEDDVMAEGAQEGIYTLETGGCRLQGCPFFLFPGLPESTTPLGAFRPLWDSLYARRGLGFDANPWVLVYDLAPCAKPEGWPS